MRRMLHVAEERVTRKNVIAMIADQAEMPLHPRQDCDPIAELIDAYAR